jgi:hypothetical protein
MAVTIAAFSASISTSTSLTSVGYTTATNTTAFAVGLNVANVATTNRTAYVDVVRFDGTNNHYIVRQAPVYPGSSISPIRAENKFAMESGYQIRVAVTSTATPIDCTLSIVEIT